MTSENFIPALYSLKRYERVPLKMPSMLLISSPVLMRSVRRMFRMGRPAPTVVSSPHLAPVFSIAAMHDFQRFRSPLPTFLLGVTTCTPLPSHMSYMFETNSEAVVSMITAWSATPVR